MTPYEMVLEFHKTFGVEINKKFSPNLVQLRHSLIREEFREVDEELFPHHAGRPDEKKLTKELADLMYVTIGTAITFGLPLEEVFAEVHKSNMSKLTKEGYVLRREDGKVLKSDQYQEPNLERYFEI